MKKSLPLPVAASCAVVAILAATAPRADAVLYATPAGGWLFAYDGSVDPTAAGFSHDNGSDEWDGSAIGAGRPGGASVLSGGGVDFLRLQDTGDPRDYGFSDPGSNRKLYFTHAAGLSASPLDTGVTLYFRTRLATGAPLDDAHPDGGGGIIPWPAGGDGYAIHDGGKGMFGIKQSTGGIVSFSLAESLTGLTMNNLNGNTVTGDVDTGEGGTANNLSLGDGADWHDIWVTIAPGGSGTHQASIYLDGSLTPTVFDVTAGSGSDSAGSYIAFGFGSTGFAGAGDVDFFNVYEGAVAPQLIPEPAMLPILGLPFLLLRRRRAR